MGPRCNRASVKPIKLVDIRAILMEKSNRFPLDPQVPRSPLYSVTHLLPTYPKFTIHEQRRRFGVFQIPRARQAINGWSSILPIREICIFPVILFLSLMILFQIALLSISGSNSFRSADLHRSSYNLLLFIGSEKALRRLGEGETLIQFMVLASHLCWLLWH